MKTCLCLLFISCAGLAAGQTDTIVMDLARLKQANAMSVDGYYLIKKNGIVMEECRVVAGRMVGIKKEYYDTGHLRRISETGYFQNRLHLNGLYCEYYESGNIRLEGYYAYTDSIDCVNCYDPGQSQIITKAASHSARAGEWREFFENGQLSSAGYYKGIHELYSYHFLKQRANAAYGVFTPGDYSEEYLKDREWRYYNEQGQLVKEEYYFNGVLAEVSTYDR